MQHLPTILHNKDGEKKLVKDEGEYNSAKELGWSDSPADFTPEDIEARKKAKELADAEAKKQRIHDERVAKALKLLEDVEAGKDPLSEDSGALDAKAEELAKAQFDLEADQEKLKEDKAALAKEKGALTKAKNALAVEKKN